MDVSLEPARQEYEDVEKLLSTIESKKNKIMELYEENLIEKEDFTKRFNSLNEQKEQLKQRIGPMTQQKSREEKLKRIDYKTVQQVMQNFSEAFKGSLTREQRKSLIHLLIEEITISESRKIETIQVHLNKEVINHFINKEGEKSSDRDYFSPSFSFVIDINQAKGGEIH